MAHLFDIIVIKISSLDKIQRAYFAFEAIPVFLPNNGHILTDMILPVRVYFDRTPHKPYLANF
jgi:hypothetical protein